MGQQQTISPNCTLQLESCQKSFSFCERRGEEEDGRWCNGCVVVRTAQRVAAKSVLRCILNCNNGGRNNNGIVVIVIIIEPRIIEGGCGRFFFAIAKCYENVV